MVVRSLVSSMPIEIVRELPAWFNDSFLFQIQRTWNIVAVMQVSIAIVYVADEMKI